MRNKLLYSVCYATGTVDQEATQYVHGNPPIQETGINKAYWAI